MPDLALCPLPPLAAQPPLKPRTLCCSNTGLDPDGMRELCDALRENKSLTDLNLSKNRFGGEGAAMLEEVLDSAPSLKFLDVRR